METIENQQRLLDVNGREIKMGSFGRLSEKGRAEIISQVPNWIKESANLRFKIIGLTKEHGKVLVEPIEISTNLQVVLDTSCVVIENE